MSGFIKSILFVLSVLVTIGSGLTIKPSWPSKFGVLVNYHSREYEGQIFHINDSDNNMFVLSYDQSVSIYYPSENRRYIKSNKSGQSSCYNTDLGIGKDYPRILPDISNFELMGEDSGLEIWQLVDSSNPYEFYQMHIRIKTGAPVCFLHLKRDTNGESDVIKRLDYSGYSTSLDLSDYEYHRIGCYPRSEQMEEFSSNHKMDSRIDMAYVEKVVPASTEWLESSIGSRFASYLVEYEKEYSPSEYLHRLHIFRKRLAVNEGHNHRASEMHRLAINKFSDMGEDERKAFLGFGSSSIPQELMIDFDEHKPSLRLKNLPESINWVERNVVTPVKDQKNCPACWAFSVTAAVESAYAIAIGKLKSFSEQHLIDCVQKNQGCDGGNVSNTYQYLIEAHGLISEKKYKFKAKTGKCRAAKLLPKSKARVWDFRRVPKGEAKIMEALATMGPLSITMNTDGIHELDGKSVYQANDCERGSDHALLLVGYGRTPKNEGDIPYWLVKNSWGKKWGDKGYFKIIRHNNTLNGPCNMYKWVTYPLVRR